MSNLRIRSGFCVYTGPSEQCGTPACAPCSGGRQPRPGGPISHFPLSSLSSSPDPYPAWHALCFIWPAGLLHSRGPLRATTAPKYSFTTQNHTISMCSGRQLHQIERVSSVGGGECFPALGAARPVSSETQCYSLVLSSKRKQTSSVRWQRGYISWFL